MNNKEIANQFSLLSKLMDIHGENSFKSKTYSIAAFKIGQLTVDLQTLSEKELASIQEISEALGKKISEINATGKLKILEDLLSKTPEGILEMLNIKGIGPKKIGLIWNEMGLENIGELLYACNENRLLLYKGFGKKTQENVIASIDYYLSQKGNFLWAKAEDIAQEIHLLLSKMATPETLHITGDFVRHAETIDRLEFLISLSADQITETLSVLEDWLFLEKKEDALVYRYQNGIKIELHPTEATSLVRTQWVLSGAPEFVNAFDLQFPGVLYQQARTEEDVFSQAGLPYIPPYLREDPSILSMAAEHKIPELIQPGDIKGIIHCHSNWSDGINTLEEMATACIKSGKEYLVISDHSKSATYAHGLSEEQILAQHALIDELNSKLHPFKIFKSIESDILGDGSLDYSDTVLASFDLVIASVHSNLKMTQAKAMTRLLKAIENPYTTILGHMTGRLLLSRPGFPLDHQQIIDACAAHQVVIEINAHPRRLDMRWQWIDYALCKKVLLSIDPDAHSLPEFENTRYGVLVAQKAMLTPADNLSSFSLEAMERFVTGRKIS